MNKIMRFFKKIVLLILFFFLCVFVGQKFMGGNVHLNEVIKVSKKDHYNSPYIYVLNRESSKKEYAKRGNKKVYPASLTKIMTTLVALEHIDNLSEVAPVDVETYKKMVEHNASMAGFYGREAVTYRDLLYGTILSSGGEAANSLAIHIGGNVENFVKLMNQKSKELGLKNTHFANPEGLHDEKQYTTAKDMAKLLDHALENNDFRAIFTKETFHTTATLDHPQGLTLTSTVLSELPQGEERNFQVLGGKSGTTQEAGQCWATFGEKDGQEYIVIVMGAPLKDISSPDKAQIEDTIKLYENITP